MFQSGLRSWAGFVAIYMKWVLWVFHALHKTSKLL